VRNFGSYNLTEKAVEVYLDGTAERIHIRSYDFYVDGLTLKPLKSIFYKSYRSKLVSEYDNYFRNTKNDERIIERSMKPDMVHCPVDNEKVISEIKTISYAERDAYGIPSGFRDINDLSHTKMTFQVLIVASTDGRSIYKEMIDGFAVESYLENSMFYDDIKKNVLDFEKNIKHKIKNLIFKYKEPTYNRDNSRKADEMIMANWQEIDNYQEYSNQIFSHNFSEVKNIVKQKIGVEIEFPDDFLENKKAIEINVDSRMLKKSSDRALLISNLMRGRDYIFDVRYTNHNVQLIYFYYSVADKVVEKILDLNFLIDSIGEHKIEQDLLLKQVENCFTTLKQLLLLGGNYEVLEKFDIAQHMSVY
jgi:predicted DsbA family dithiol-disulfide isomerase